MPENKFSKVLPKLADGKLGSMEISSNSVSYQLYDVSNENYDNYVNELLEQGYTMLEDGTFTKDGYNITMSFTENGNMTISLKTD